VTASALLTVTDLVAGYGGNRVLKEISLEVSPGGAIAVLGANGAGKSTLMKCISGLLKPWQGRITFEGRDITAVPAERRAGLGVVLVPEGRGLFTTMTIEENLLVGATGLRRRTRSGQMHRLLAEGLDRAYELFPVLKDRRNDLAAKLSGGQQQMVAIARALMAHPKLLLLDEPCLGLAPKVGNEVYRALRILREQGMSLVVVEESTRRALAFVDRACVLKLGSKVLEDDAQNLTRDEALLEAYFGLTSEAKDVTL
jgi:branched-chain amino acid transport system ATP-binding protein